MSLVIKIKEARGPKYWGGNEYTTVAVIIASASFVTYSTLVKTCSLLKKS